MKEQVFLVRGGRLAAGFPEENLTAQNIALADKPQADPEATDLNIYGPVLDIVVAHGKIVEVRPALAVPEPAGIKIVNAEGLLVLPSLVDGHVHLREPGFEWKEDIASGLKAAAAGGFGQVVAMPNTSPVNDTAQVTTYTLQAAAKAWPAGPFLRPVGALTLELEGRQTAPLKELAEAGCVAFSNDGLPVADTEIFRRAWEYATDLGLPVVDHSEDPFLAVGSGLNEGRISSLLGLVGQPDVAETIQVARDILLAEYLDLPIHLAHISSRRSLDLIAWAKSRGIKVSAETCPHYLFFGEDDVLLYNTNAKVNPPLKCKEDREALVQALKSGVIDILTTDHAPHARHEKDVPFEEAPCGMTGLDTALSLTWRLVEEGQIKAADLVRLWLEGPAKIFNLPANKFRPGDPADFILFDPNKQWLVTPQSVFSKSCNTLCENMTLSGKVVAHFIAGRQVW